MIRTFIASPWRGSVKKNTAYARRALADSLAKGEAPYAPHLLYPQVLDEAGGRFSGQAAGLEFLKACELLAAYADHGISEGMQVEINYAKAQGIRVELRRIGL